MVCTLEELTPLVTFLISFLISEIMSSKFMRGKKKKKCFAGTVVKIIMTIKISQCKSQYSLIRVFNVT